MRKTFIGLIACCFVGVASAAPIVYEGQLFDGITEYGSASDPLDTGSDYWFFEAQAGDILTLVGHRLEAPFDMAVYLYSGTYADTTALPASIAFADDEIPELPGYEGPWADPQLLNFVLPGPGLYTVQVWDFLSGPGDPPFDYQITITGTGGDPVVPEPATMTLLGLGIVGLAARARRNRK